MYCKVKQAKQIKILLLKIFILQKKNRLSFNITLPKSSLALLLFLWKIGLILGFMFSTLNIYTVFLKRQLKHFNINFFKLKLGHSDLCLFKKAHTTSTALILCSKGRLLSPSYTRAAGGFLLCNIY